MAGEYDDQLWVYWCPKIIRERLYVILEIVIYLFDRRI